MFRSTDGLPGGGTAPDGELRIVLVAFEDFTDLDLFFMWDLLNRVHLPHWSVRIVGEAPVHRSMTGLTVPIHGPLEEANSAHAVLFTSGKGNRAKLEDAAYLARFRLDPERQLIGSICSGALLLAALGLLEGKRATTYPSAKPLLEAYGVQVVEEPFVVEGNVATAGGCLSAQYLAGWVIERLAGAELSQAVLTSCQPVGEGLYFDTDVEALPPAALAPVQP
jgi:transcriptional regulator GlxA family with amidase domain